MSKTIIVEGVDASGKTTLCDVLRQHGYIYRHHTLTTETPRQLFAYYVRQIWAAAHRKQPTVLDRSFLSERVYGSNVRTHDRMGEVGYRLLTRLTRALGIGEVIALPPWETVRDAWTEKKQEKWDPVNHKGDYLEHLEVVRRVYHGYRQLLDQRSWTLRYDWTLFHGNIDIQVAQMLAAELPRLPKGCLGSPTATVLFVGEQVNLKKTVTDLPFFALDGSSGYLMRAMIAADVNEEQVALVNSLATIQTKDLVKLIAEIPTIRRVVSLGKVAAHVLRSQRLEHVELPHPSYVRRFRNDQYDWYVQDLREVMKF